MYWTEEHDKVLVREIIANNPFDGTTKKGYTSSGSQVECGDESATANKRTIFQG